MSLNESPKVWEQALLALGIVAVASGAMSCSAKGPNEEAVGTVRAAVTTAEVMGFETLASWSTTTTGAVLSLSPTHSQGVSSLALRPSNSNGFTPMLSAPLSTLAVVSPTLAWDVMLPTQQPNPYWQGTAQTYVNCPSCGIYNAFLGQVELTGKPLNVWNTITFPLNNDQVTRLLQSGYSDLTFTVVVNVQVPTSGTYRVDNLRFVPLASNACGGKPNGTACNDGNACTLLDRCQNGTCRAGSPVTCTASDSCHNPGTCNTGTGICSNPVKPNGSVCTDGNACTQTDRCQSGVCSGTNPKVCAASDQCHAAGTCNTGTGACSDPPKPNGTPCNDANACTQTDTCQTGVCTAGTAPNVDDGNPCTADFCDPVTGVAHVPLPSGAACDDGNGCTQTDHCEGGTCVGSNPKTCAVLDECGLEGECDPETGRCPGVADGTPCDDEDLCTQTDTCFASTCAGANPRTCFASDQCHGVGACDPTTGACSDPAVPDDTECDDNNDCTDADVCTAGSCSGQDNCGVAPGFADIIDLGVLSEGDWSVATAVNGVGDVAGVEGNPSGSSFAWRHSDASGLEAIAFSFEAPLSQATGINDFAVVTGIMRPEADSLTFGFAASPGAEPTLITVLGGRAVGINNAGQIAANEPLPDGTIAAFRYIGGVKEYVGRFSDPRFRGSMEAFGVGTGGEIVGAAQTFDTVRRFPNGKRFEASVINEAFVFSDTNGLDNINDDPVVRAAGWQLVYAAHAMNGNQLTGWGIINDHCRAFRYTPGVGITAIDALPGTEPPPDDPNNVCQQGGRLNYHVGRGINRYGEVVGTAYSFDPVGAFYHSDEKGVVDLNELVDPALGFHLVDAAGINDNGDIVGAMTVDGSETLHAYRMRLPGDFTEPPVPAFDWQMMPHFAGSDAPALFPPVSCPGAPQPPVPCLGNGTTLAQQSCGGSSGCQTRCLLTVGNVTRIQLGPCVPASCTSGAVTRCTTPCGGWGVHKCVAGAWGPCRDYERCDGHDTDCDGSPDNGNVCQVPLSAFDPNHAPGWDTVLDARGSTSPNSPIVQYLWDADVGTPQERRLATTSQHTAGVTFPEERVYRIRLTAIARNGRSASVTRDVWIKNRLILSLGDSVASGEGNPDIPASTNHPLPTWTDLSCQRSLFSGHAQAARELEVDPHSSVTFLARACSGATIPEGLIGVQPERASVAQIDAASDVLSGNSRQADALLLQVGANDIGFGDIVEACALPSVYTCPSELCDQTRCSTPIRTDLVKILLANLKVNNYPMLDQVLESRFGDVPVYISDYHDPTHHEETAFCPEIVFTDAVGFVDGHISRPEIVWAFENVVTPLNNTVKEAANSHGWTFIPAEPGGWGRHGYCASVPWIVRFEESLANQLNTDGTLHPNIPGHASIARQLLTVLHRDLGL